MFIEIFTSLRPESPSWTLHSRFFLKTLILAFEANSETSKNCTFLDFRTSVYSWRIFYLYSTTVQTMFRHDVLSGAPFWALNWEASTNINTNFLKLLKFVNCKIHSSVGLREGPQKWVALMAHMKLAGLWIIIWD